MAYYTYEQSIGSGHFRVLILLLAELHEPLECLLETVTVGMDTSKEISYEALSYAWGSKNEMLDILCDGRKMSITQELETALRHMRDEALPRRLWIDQICINQQDLDERSAQVKNIGTIYRSAKRIVVWLGGKSETNDLAIQFARELSEALSAFEKSYPGSMVLHQSLGRNLKPTDYYLPPNDALERTGLSDILSRKWLGRLWIVQEALLNDNVVLQCGSNQFPWAVIEELSGHFHALAISQHSSLPTQRSE